METIYPLTLFDAMKVILCIAWILFEVKIFLFSTFVHFLRNSREPHLKLFGINKKQVYIQLGPETKINIGSYIGRCTVLILYIHDLLIYKLQRFQYYIKKYRPPDRLANSILVKKNYTSRYLLTTFTSRIYLPT